jgi:hypothetical protein
MCQSQPSTSAVNGALLHKRDATVHAATIALKLGEPHVYRQFRGGLIRMSQFDGAITRTRPARQPRDRCLFEGEWYCSNERCEVRQVQMRFKFLDQPPATMPPKLHCPLCGKPLKFHHYLIDETLIRAD